METVKTTLNTTPLNIAQRDGYRINTISIEENAFDFDISIKNHFENRENHVELFQPFQQNYLNGV